MSIFDKTCERKTITEGWRALELFTNRNTPISLFLSSLNDEPPGEQILFFHGDGGNGKSLLLEFLYSHCCKRLTREDWEYVKANSADMGTDEFHGLLKNLKAKDVVPVARIDFGQPPREDYRPQEPFSALLKLRRDLGGCGLRFPLFDFACLWYLHKGGILTGEWVRVLFPAQEADLLSSIASLISGTSWGALAKSVLNLCNKHFGKQFTLYRERRQLSEGAFLEIQRMDPERELMGELPELFARDLNASLSLKASLSAKGAPHRVVLLFDTHEALWGTRRGYSSDLFFERDEWLRRLLGTLDMGAGIVVVVAGRDRPLWHNAARFVIPREFVRQQMVGYLSESDAYSYLLRAGVKGEDLRSSAVAYARFAPDEVHPFYLGLCADVALAAQDVDMESSGKDFASGAVDKGKHLMERLFRYVDDELGYAVRTLSACRSFNKEIFSSLGKSLDFLANEPTFRKLLQFSFVWHAEEKGEGWYRIHDLIIRLVRDQDSEICRKVDAVMEQYYRMSRNRLDRAEAIYHSSRLEPARGLGEWAEAFKGALLERTLGLCRTLNDIGTDLIVEDDNQRGIVSKCIGDYFKLICRYEEAEGSYREALAYGGEALRLAPKAVYTHNNRGNILRGLGDLYAELSRHVEAEGSYREALVEFEEALRLAPNDGETNYNKGDTLKGLGDLYAVHSRYVEAEGSYREALMAYGKEPNDVYTLNNRGNVLRRLGNLYAQLSRRIEAEESYRGALYTYGELLILAPDHVYAKFNRGTALKGLGDLYAVQSQQVEAEESYLESLDAYGEVLCLVPDHVYAKSSRGNVLRGLGAFYAVQSRYVEAEGSYQEALMAYSEALRLAPEAVYTHNNRGNTLIGLGDLYALQSRQGEVERSYREALDAYGEALRLAPYYVYAHHGRGNTLNGLGTFYAVLSRYVEAEGSYREALMAYGEALRLAPDYVYAHHGKGNTLNGLGDLYALQSRQGEAEGSYQEALMAYGEALRLAPDAEYIRSKEEFAKEKLRNLYEEP